MLREQPRTQYLLYPFMLEVLATRIYVDFLPQLGSSEGPKLEIVVVHIAVVGLQILGRLANYAPELRSDPPIFLFLVPSSNHGERSF